MKWPLGLILKRNNRLMWANNQIRLFIIVIVDWIIIFRIGSLTDVLSGAVVSANTPILPINWFFLLLSPILILGDYIEKIVKSDYISVNVTGLNLYLTSVFFQVTFLTSGLVFSWILVSSNRINIAFYAYIFIALNVLTLFYGVLSILLGSIYGEIIFTVMLLLTTSGNYIPIFSPLMFIHFMESNIWVDLLSLLPVIVLVLLLPFLLKQIDFN